MRKAGYHKRIPFRLSVILAGILLVISASIELPVYYHKTDRVRANLDRMQFGKAQHLAQEIDMKIRERMRFVDTLATLIPARLLGERDRLQDFLKKSVELVEYFPLGLVIVHPDGKSSIAAYSPLSGLDALAYDGLDWFGRALGEGGVVVGSPFKSRTTGDFMMVFAAAIRGASGTPIGVVAAPVLLDSPQFLGFAYPGTPDPFSEVLVVSRTDRLFVASPRKDQILRPLPEPGAVPLQDKAMAGFTGTGLTVNELGSQDIVAVVNIASLDWYVVIRTPADLALTPVWEEVHKDIAASLLLILVVVLTIFVTLAIYFRPLEHAARQVRTMGGDVALPHLAKVRDDEIGDLVTGFNTLVDAVNQRTRDLEEANTRLEELSRTDGLTRVFNRRWFDHCLEQSWRVHQRNGQPLSIILLDVDFFKKYNDTYGHQRGDECLTAIANALRGCLKRPMDILARYGGEEFVAIVENDAAGVRSLAESMRRAVEALAMEHGPSPHGIVTISLGVATLIPDRDASSGILVAHADAALYESKSKGRNRVEVHVGGNGPGGRAADGEIPAAAD